MSGKNQFAVGDAIVYATRPVGLTTYLLVQPYLDDKGVGDETTCTWHIELCNEGDHDQPVTSDDDTIRVDLSAAAGALVSVRNTGGWPFYAWTDY